MENALVLGFHFWLGESLSLLEVIMGVYIDRQVCFNSEGRFEGRVEVDAAAGPKPKRHPETLQSRGLYY